MADMSLEKVRMPEQDPKARIRNFDEVALGYTDEMAIKESHRCLNCKQGHVWQGARSTCRYLNS